MQEYKTVTTENDLSADVVKIDYDALIDVSSYALRCAISKMIADASEIRDNMTQPVSIPHKARYLQHTAAILTIAAETYYTLVEGMSRDEKMLVNIP